MNLDIGDFLILAIFVYGYLHNRVPKSYNQKADKYYSYIRNISLLCIIVFTFKIIYGLMIKFGVIKWSGLDYDGHKT